MTMTKIRAAIRDSFGIMPTLDLHGLGVKSARTETERFLREAQEEGLGSVRIIYGKGHGSPGRRGILRETVTRWLDTNGREFARRWERHLDSSGEDGGVIVWIRLPEFDEEED